MNDTKISTPKTTRGMLDLIDKFLSRCNRESGELWDVLSALRGPDDDGDEQLKKRTTILIRRAAFSKLRRVMTHATWTSGPSGRCPGMNGLPSYDATGGSKHFCTHADGAAKVLGLK